MKTNIFNRALIFVGLSLFLALGCVPLLLGTNISLVLNLFISFSCALSVAFIVPTTYLSSSFPQAAKKPTKKYTKPRKVIPTKKKKDINLSSSSDSSSSLLSSYDENERTELLRRIAGPVFQNAQLPSILSGVEREKANTILTRFFRLLGENNASIDSKINNSELVFNIEWFKNNEVRSYLLRTILTKLQVGNHNLRRLERRDPSRFERIKLDSQQKLRGRHCTMQSFISHFYTLLRELDNEGLFNRVNNKKRTRRVR